MKLAIVGSRSIKDNMTAELAAKDILHEWKKLNDIEAVISGKAQGPDTWGEFWAIANGIKVIEFPAKWKLPNGKIDKGAGFKRNHDIVQTCDWLVAFWDGHSNGTKHDFELCEQYHKGYTIYKWNPNKWVFEETQDWR